MTLLLLAMLGCTFTPGGGFARMEEVRLDVAFEAGEARDLGDGAFLTDLAWTVEVDSFDVDLGDLVLEEFTGGSGATFDPADPPAGYGNCHDGHCHHESGALVDFADIQLELSGGGAFQTAIDLPVGATADLLAGATYTLQPDQPELPAMDLRRIGLETSSLRLTGTASHDDHGEVPLVIDLELPARFASGVALPIDRDTEPVFALDLSITVDGTLLDGLDLSAFDDQAALVVHDRLVSTVLLTILTPLDPS